MNFFSLSFQVLTNGTRTILWLMKANVNLQLTSLLIKPLMQHLLPWKNPWNGVIIPNIVWTLKTPDHLGKSMSMAVDHVRVFIKLGNLSTLLKGDSLKEKNVNFQTVKVNACAEKISSNWNKSQKKWLEKYFVKIIDSVSIQNMFNWFHEISFKEEVKLFFHFFCISVKLCKNVLLWIVFTKKQD